MKSITFQVSTDVNAPLRLSDLQDFVNEAFEFAMSPDAEIRIYGRGSGSGTTVLMVERTERVDK